uniref:Vitellogenin n=1 Tax=Gongylonema pulchrum TaxID=637853 RepID=A0A183DUR9_9BILA
LHLNAEQNRSLQASLPSSSRSSTNSINQKAQMEQSLQASLPSSSRSSTNSINQKAQMEQFLERYTKEQTRQDYRFWIMAKMMQPLLDSLIEVLSERPTDRALAATGEWLRTHWQPSVMRPNASSMLVYLATHTGMLTDPSGLQEHIQRELSRQ